jgi:hypothetical protein
MSVVMKGMGVAVVIVFFAAAGLMAIWYDNITLGNFEYTKWVFLITGVISLLLSLSTLSKEKIMKHTLMFIPIIVWGLIFLTLGIYQFTL